MLKAQNLKYFLESRKTCKRIDRKRAFLKQSNKSYRLVLEKSKYSTYIDPAEAAGYSRLQLVTLRADQESNQWQDCMNARVVPAHQIRTVSVVAQFAAI